MLHTLLPAYSLRRTAHVRAIGFRVTYTYINMIFLSPIILYSEDFSPFIFYPSKRHSLIAKNVIKLHVSISRRVPLFEVS
jgi:hypothetical protein